MRSHTVQSHGVQITKYKEMYGQLEIIEKVFHKCHLCGKIVLLDSDTLGAHIKRAHKMKERAYKKKFCIYKPAAGVKQSLKIKKPRVKKFVYKPPEDKTSLAGLEKEESETRRMKFGEERELKPIGYDLKKPKKHEPSKKVEFKNHGWSLTIKTILY